MNRGHLFRINRQVGYHVVAWTVFILYEVSFVQIIRWSHGTVPVWTGYILPYIINMALFYVHAFGNMKTCFDTGRKKMLLFVLLVGAELLVYLLCMGLKEYAALPHHTPPYLSLFASQIDFIQQLWRGIYFLIFSTAFWLIHSSFQKAQRLKEAETRALLQQQEKRELELRLMSTQNAFLRSQINPHLLFNTLNFIHNEVEQLSPKASDAIITLSDMMRYSMAETRVDGKVELSREVEQIKNLIVINQFRFEGRLFILLSTEGNLQQADIIPLLLIPFVENLFKYAELTDASDPVLIYIGVEQGRLRFKTHNKKRRTVSYRSPGIGIDNVKTRLQSYYADHYYLDIQSTKTHFSVNLNIELN